MRRMQFVPALAIALASSLASAQAVHKCTDANGRTTFTSIPCSHIKQDGKVVLKERSERAMAHEHFDYVDAVNAKMERKEREHYQQQLLENERQLRRMMATADAPTPSATQRPNINQSISKFAKPQTRAQRGLPPVATPSAPARHSPSVITHCAGGFCHDNLGGVYHNHGNGVTSTGPGGGTCVNTGGSVICH